MPENIRDVFCANLQTLMKLRGITQSDIALALDVSSSTVSDWCNGKKYPRADKVQKLADLLDVKFSSLTNEDALEKNLQDIEDADRIKLLHEKPYLRDLFDQVKVLNDDDIQLLIQFVKKLNHN